MSAHTIIIGAGVAGLASAWRLARRGQQVTIIEREVAGAGASRAAAGMLAPTAEVRFEEAELLTIGQRSLSLYPRFVEELEADSGLSVDYRDEGTLVVALDRDDTAELEHLLAYQRSLGLDVAMLSGDQARDLEPALSPRVHAAVRCASDHQIDPRSLVAALTAACRARGVVLREGTSVESIALDGDVMRGVVVEGGELIEAHRVIAAAGAWTRKLGGLPRGALPQVRPVLGQMLSVEMGATPLCRHVIRGPEAYLVPKSDGRLIIGATMEERGFDTRHRLGGLMEIMRGAWEILPDLYERPIIETWTGLRPISASNMPIIALSEVCRELIWCCGHGRGGILLTPWTAHQIEAMLG
jgi:glycine oxidase